MCTMRGIDRVSLVKKKVNDPEQEFSINLRVNHLQFLSLTKSQIKVKKYISISTAQRKNSFN